VVALVDEPLRDRRADAATRAGDDDVSAHSSIPSSSLNVGGANWRFERADSLGQSGEHAARRHFDGRGHRLGHGHRGLEELDG